MNLTVFIIGGDSGIGLLIARHFVRAGAQRIGLIGRDPDAGVAAAKSVFELASGIWSLSAAGDLSSDSEASRMISELSGSLGDADILVDCLGPDGTIVSDLVLQGMREFDSGVIIDVVAQSSAGDDTAGASKSAGVHRHFVVHDPQHPDHTAAAVVAAASP